MKKLNGKSKLINIILLFTLIAMSACSKEKQYDTTLSYENNTNLGVKIVAYRGSIQPKSEWELYLSPEESASTVITRYTSETVFETIDYFNLLFDDGHGVMYDRLNNSHLGSNTNLFNLSLYHRDGGIFKLQISEKHYNESTKE